MNKADREARRRYQAEQRRAREQEVQLRQSAVVSERAIRAEIDDLVPQVLAALKARDWPNGDSVKVSGGRGRRTRVRAGWKIASHMHYSGLLEKQYPIWLYLLSNGRFAFNGGRAVRASQVVDIPQVEIRDSLKRKLHTLTRGA